MVKQNLVSNSGIPCFAKSSAPLSPLFTFQFSSVAQSCLTLCDPMIHIYSLAKTSLTEKKPSPLWCFSTMGQHFTSPITSLTWVEKSLTLLSSHSATPTESFGHQRCQDSHSLPFPYCFLLLFCFRTTFHTSLVFPGSVSSNKGSVIWKKKKTELGGRKTDFQSWLLHIYLDNFETLFLQLLTEQIG